jgi:transposase
MDVDKKKIVVAKLLADRGSEVQERVIANTPSAVKKYFAPLASETDVMASYEAGCFGFTLYRELTEMGVACLLAAPGLIPRKPSDRVKTDRRDARTLALALRAGGLTGVHIPSKHDEAVRDYLRAYEDLRSDLRKTKQRVLHFLMRRGISYTGGSNWTVGHKQWLASLQFEEDIERQTLDLYLAHLLELERKCAEVASVAEKIGEQKRYRAAVKKLRAFKGIKTLTALAFICEIADFRRFASARQFMAFLGMVPSEHSSGNKRRQGGITKAGNSHLRGLLVEAAWHYRSYHSASRRLAERRKEVDPQMVAYANRAGRRLNRKYLRLLHSGKPAQVAVTAAGRELAGFLWGAMVDRVA